MPVRFSPPQCEQYYCHKFILHHPFNVLPIPVGNETWKVKYCTLTNLPELSFANLESFPSDIGHFESQSEVQADPGQSEVFDFLRSRMADYEALCSNVNFEHYPQNDWTSDADILSEREVAQFKTSIEIDAPVADNRPALPQLLKSEQLTVYQSIESHGDQDPITNCL